MRPVSATVVHVLHAAIADVGSMAVGHNPRVTSSTDEAASRYDRAEATYLDRLRQGQSSGLAEVAALVAEAAEAWQATAYGRYFATKGQQGESSGAAVQDEITAEKAEVLAGLWSDIAAAHRAADALA
jgi:hypothetical protein